jgi:hypothetical protein
MKDLRRNVKLYCETSYFDVMSMPQGQGCNGKIVHVLKSSGV